MVKRVLQLDILRAAAIFLVLLHHTILPHFFSSPVILFFVRHITAGGWLGVDLFFVLSGFLVSGLLFNEFDKRGQIDVKRFLIRRGFKIYPSFWVFILATCIINLLHSYEMDPLALLSELLFVQNYAPTLTAHTWSLAIEEHFYILFALLMFYLVKAKIDFKAIISVFLIASALCLIFRLVQIDINNHFNFRFHLAKTHLRIDALLFGVVLSYLYRYKHAAVYMFLNSNKKLLLVLCCIILPLPFLFIREYNLWMVTLPITLIYVSFGILLMFFLKMDLPDSYWLNLLGVLGKYSYTIYLWHLIIHDFWLKYYSQILGTFTNGFTYLSGYFLFSILFGVVISKLIEYPTLKLRDKLFPA